MSKKILHLGAKDLSKEKDLPKQFKALTAAAVIVVEIRIGLFILLMCLFFRRERRQRVGRTEKKARDW